MQNQKTVLCIQDLSSVGRCSLAVVIPALASMGIQPCAVPTALLSTHPGGFGRPVIHGESDFLHDALEHYRRLGLSFSCVYSGYLADAQQADLVHQAFAQNPDALKIVDPVMADHGKLYSSADDTLCGAVSSLCAKADYIVPNTTEAAILLGTDPAEHPFGDAEIAQTLDALLQKYPALHGAVITGVQHADGRHGNACIVRGQSPDFIPYSHVPQAYPGTGDLFAAILTGCLLLGYPLSEAVRTGADFVSDAAHATLKSGSNPCFGVHFEPLLGRLAAGILCETNHN